MLLPEKTLEFIKIQNYKLDLSENKDYLFRIIPIINKLKYCPHCPYLGNEDLLHEMQQLFYQLNIPFENDKDYMEGYLDLLRKIIIYTDSLNSEEKVDLVEKLERIPDSKKLEMMEDIKELFKLDTSELNQFKDDILNSDLDDNYKKILLEQLTLIIDLDENDRKKLLKELDLVN